MLALSWCHAVGQLVMPAISQLSVTSRSGSRRSSLASTRWRRAAMGSGDTTRTWPVSYARRGTSSRFSYARRRTRSLPSTSRCSMKPASVGHPSGCPATVNWVLALKSHPAHGVIGRDRGATTKQQSQGKEEELMDKKRKGAKKKGPKQEGCKTVPVRREIIEAQRQRFIEKFGRDWGPHDPNFFDPSADEPRPMIDEVLDQHLLEAMHKAGIRPAMIYAYQKTGRLVTYKNRKHLNARRN